MKRQTKWFLIPCAAMALTMGSALVSFAATGWAEENGEWVYYNNDGSKATDVFKKSGNNWFYLDSEGMQAINAQVDAIISMSTQPEQWSRTSGAPLKMKTRAQTSRMNSGTISSPTARL